MIRFEAFVQLAATAEVEAAVMRLLLRWSGDRASIRVMVEAVSRLCRQLNLHHPRSPDAVRRLAVLDNWLGEKARRDVAFFLGEHHRSCCFSAVEPQMIKCPCDTFWPPSLRGEKIKLPALLILEVIGTATQGTKIAMASPFIVFLIVAIGSCWLLCCSKGKNAPIWESSASLRCLVQGFLVP